MMRGRFERGTPRHPPRDAAEGEADVVDVAVAFEPAAVAHARPDDGERAGERRRIRVDLRVDVREKIAERRLRVRPPTAREEMIEEDVGDDARVVTVIEIGRA